MKLYFTSILCIILFGVNAQNQSFPGFAHAIEGETISYHAPQPDAGEALLVRSESADQHIIFKTATVPENHAEDFVTFNLMMAIDVNPEDPHKWDFLVNDQKLFTLSSPHDTILKTIVLKGEKNTEFVFEATEVDKYGDFTGFARIKIPTRLIEKGQSAKIKVIGENAHSRTWLMIYKYRMVSSFHIQAENAIRKGKSGNERVVKLEIVQYHKGAKAEINIGNESFTQPLKYGYNKAFKTFQANNTDRNIPYSVRVDGKLFDQGEIQLKPIKHMTISLLHHSHVDIGYTHVQREVEQKQWSYIEQCLALSEASQHQPQEARFKWNIEVMWALDSYWKKANPEQKQRLKTAIQKGWIELDAFYANELTGLCSSEELMQLMNSALKMASECEVELQSAMLSDVPGWSWGIVPALSQAGVKYLSLGTNTFHRIGSTIEEWGDKPFYWQSASGKEKVLTWIHGKGYSSFHTGLGAENLKNKLDEEILLTYMNELQDQQYPYNKVILRYNIGSDNGPPDSLLSEKVKSWNEKYITPKLKIATTTESFAEFEEAYAEALPVIKGDFTGYWEDGAASSAKETAINRNSAHALSQAQYLYSLAATAFPENQFEEVWKKIMLYDEHTWGSWNSISDPQSDFTKQQWAVKRAFAIEASKKAHELKLEAWKDRYEEKSSFIEVINTHSWPVKDIVTIPTALADNYNAIKDFSGKTITSQKLSDGRIIFISDEIPAFSSLRYQLFQYNVTPHSDLVSDHTSIENDIYRITLDENSAVVKALIWKEKNINLVSEGKFSGLNEYIYVEGRNPKDQSSLNDAMIVMEENGDVITSLKAIYPNSKGCNSVSSTYKIYHGLDRIDICNVLNKKEIYHPEGIHFAFPFQIHEGILRYDLAYGVCQPNKDQINGSNKNFITIENWVDISNSEYGVTWISKDAPLIEIDDIHNDPIATGYLKKVPASQTFLSYVMNNYWETNYLAAQPGTVQFNYTLYPHQGYNPAFSERKALQVQEPLLIMPIHKDAPPLSFEYSLNNENLIIQSIIPIKKDQYIIRIFNAGNKSERVRWKVKPKAFYRWDNQKRKREKIVLPLELVPMETITILLEK